MLKKQRRTTLGRKYPNRKKPNPFTKEHKQNMKGNRTHKPDCQCVFCKAQRGEMKGRNAGEKNGMWSGSLTQTSSGYWWIQIKKGQSKILRARATSEQYLKRKLLKREIVHHINGNKSDDRPENLYVFATRGDHTSYHGLKNAPILISNII